MKRVVRVLAVALAAAALIPLLGVDPAILTVLDGDLLALAGLTGLAMLGTDARLIGRRTWHRIGRSLPVLWIRVGVSLTRSDPGSMIGA